MAMAWIWTGMVVVSVVYGLYAGTIGAVGSAAMEGAASAVELCLSMAGGDLPLERGDGHHEGLRPDRGPQQAVSSDSQPSSPPRLSG